jgi:hypothetical protein
MAVTRRQAVGLAEQFSKAVISRREKLGSMGKKSHDGIAVVFVEHWEGTATEGRWERLGLHRGGFCHVFPNGLPGRSARRNPALPKSGDKVECLLLPKKTRKGGWRAKLANCELAGPVTNTSDVPATAKPEQVVILLVGAVSQAGDHIQFRWLSGADRGNGEVCQSDVGRTVTSSIS